MSAATDTPRFLARVERANLVLALVVLAGTHLAAGFGPLFWGAAAGAAIGAANFSALRWLGSRLVHAEARTRGFYAVLFTAKLAVLGTIIVLALAFLPLDVLGFLVGISTTLPAVLLVHLGQALAPAPPRTPSAGTTPSGAAP